jgi:hypothetical protein
MTQAIRGLNESRSSISARAAAASDQVPDGDCGPRVVEQEERLAAIHASGRDTRSHHNCQDPWLEQRAQGN